MDLTGKQETQTHSWRDRIVIYPIVTELEVGANILLIQSKETQEKTLVPGDDSCTLSNSGQAEPE